MAAEERAGDALTVKAPAQGANEIVSAPAEIGTGSDQALPVLPEYVEAADEADPAGLGDSEDPDGADQPSAPSSAPAVVGDADPGEGTVADGMPATAASEHERELGPADEIADDDSGADDDATPVGDDDGSSADDDSAAGPIDYAHTTPDNGPHTQMGNDGRGVGGVGDPRPTLAAPASQRFSSSPPPPPTSRSGVAMIAIAIMVGFATSMTTGGNSCQPEEVAEDGEDSIPKELQTVPNLVEEIDGWELPSTDTVVWTGEGEGNPLDRCLILYGGRDRLVEGVLLHPCYGEGSSSAPSAWCERGPRSSLTVRMASPTHTAWEAIPGTCIAPSAMPPKRVGSR